MNRLSARVIRLEFGTGNSWRRYIGKPAGMWPDTALLDYLRETQGWPAGYIPSDEELRAIAVLDEGGPSNARH